VGQEIGIMNRQTCIATLISAGRPVLFLALLCAGMGTLFLSLGSETGLVFLAAAIGSLVVFFITARVTHTA
jgi:hypothetical protein